MNHRYLAVLALLASACGSHGGSAPTPVASAPQIACPADLTVRGVNGPSQAVSFDAPTVTGGTAPVNVTCVQASGSTFPLGTTPVQCTAADAGGRQAACSFNVTLTGQSLSVSTYDALGDSMTAGENALPLFIDTPNAYPTKLQALLDASYPGQTSVKNKGHSGDPVEVTDALIKGGVLNADRPGAVLLLSGYNNLTFLCPNGASGTAACRKAIGDLGLGIRDCIRHIKESAVGVKFIFVSTLTPPGPRQPGSLRDNRIDANAIVQANNGIKQMVASEGAVLVDPYPQFIGHESDYVSIDGLHLTPAGYQVIADNFFAALRNTIPQTPLSNGLR